jgi:phosphoribosylanthranilate isomerase
VEAFVHERCIGIDLNSRFETSPAYKDIHLLRSFIDKIKRK